MQIVIVLLCNCTPAQHPHHYQNMGTNSHPQCCIRLPFTMLGNSLHYSSIHKKLGISDNIFMRLILTSISEIILHYFLVFTYMYKDRNLLQTNPKVLSRKLFQDILKYMWTANTAWYKRSFVSFN